MGTRKFRPTSPSRRSMSGNDFADLTKGAKVEKSLIAKKSKKVVAITTVESPFVIKVVVISNDIVLSILSETKLVLRGVDSLQYDPNSTAFIALINYIDGEKRYILAPKGLQVGDIVSSETCDINPGTVSHYSLFQMVLRFIISKCNQVAVDNCVVLLVLQQL